jgi:predicted DNA-binding transcriptional regulator AlpA
MQQKQPLEPIIVSVPTAAELCSTSRQNLYLLEKNDPTFPKIIKLGRRKSGILYKDLCHWAEEKARGGIEK